MNVITKDLTKYEIDGGRGEKLKALIRTGNLPVKINLDGRGLMVDPRAIMLIDGEIIEPTPDTPPKKQTEVRDKSWAWGVAIRRNFDERHTLGTYGSWTAQKILDEHQTLQGGQGEMRHVDLQDTQTAS